MKVPAAVSILRPGFLIFSPWLWLSPLDDFIVPLFVMIFPLFACPDVVHMSTPPCPVIVVTHVARRSCLSLTISPVVNVTPPFLFVLLFFPHSIAGSFAPATAITLLVSSSYPLSGISDWLLVGTRLQPFSPLDFRSGSSLFPSADCFSVTGLLVSISPISPQLCFGPHPLLPPHVHPIRSGLFHFRVPSAVIKFGSFHPTFPQLSASYHAHLSTFGAGRCVSMKVLVGIVRLSAFFPISSTSLSLV